MEWRPTFYKFAPNKLENGALKLFKQVWLQVIHILDSSVCILFVSFTLSHFKV